MAVEGVPQLQVGQLASLACLLEVSTPKPGNVHRGADFEDLTFADFLASSIAVAPAMQAARQSGVGRAVLVAIQATRALVQSNTNLGTVLLLAPLAAVPRDRPLAEGIGDVLASLTDGDAEAVFAAIRLAAPGGLGRVEQMDVHSSPSSDLLTAMKAASTRDLVARQYSNGFAEVLQKVVPWLVQREGDNRALAERVIRAHLRLMAEFPDSLIARKCGDKVAAESAQRAARVLATGDSAEYAAAIADFDFWLRSDHHRRNPGTTADLIAAGLFAALRDGQINPPFR